jgi:ABC-2 type transport system permease protein
MVRSALVELTLVRIREFVREPEAVFWSFVFPLLLAGGLGIAFRDRPPEAVHAGVAGATPAADSAAAALRAAGVLVERLADDSAAGHALRTGRVALVVRRGPDGAAEYRYDPTRPEARNARLQVDAALQRAAGRHDALAARDAHVVERGSRYIDFLVPGLLGMNLMGDGVWSIAFGIVTARKQRLLKRLSATPMSRVDFLLSFLLSRLLFLALGLAVFLGFAALVFDVPFRGGLAPIVAVSLLAAFTFGSLGLLVSSRVKTIEGVSGLANAVMLPMWVCSGVFFSATNFPDAVQPFIQALPLTATVDALRASMLQGASLGAVGHELGIIAAWAAVPFVVALRIFRWR